MNLTYPNPPVHPVRTNTPHTFAEFVSAANVVLREMVDDGVITVAERTRMVLLSYPRRQDELLAPFATDGQFHGLIVEECQSDPVSDPAWLDYERDGNAEMLAKAQALFFRAAFTPSLSAALDSSKRHNFADQLQERMVRHFTRNPTPTNSAVQTIVLAKSAAQPMSTA